MLNVIAMLVVVRRAGGAGQRRVRRRCTAGWRGSPPTSRPSSGWVFRPIAWVMGVPWHDSGAIGGLLGTRMVLNEFIAYAQLGPLQGHARSALLHHRVVRAGRLRQLQLGRHPDRRHRRARARAEARPRPARLPGHAGRHARQLPVGHDRGDPAVTARGAWPAARPTRRPRRSATGSTADAERRHRARAPGSGRLADRLADAVRIPYTRHSRTFPSPTVDGPQRRAGGRAPWPADACWSRAAAFTCTRGMRRRSRALPVRVFAALGHRTR